MKHVAFLWITLVGLLAACTEKSPVDLPEPNGNAYSVDVMTTAPTSVEGSEMVLPVGSRIQVASDNMSILVTLPSEYGFLYEASAAATLPESKVLPVTSFATYTCKCSGQGSNCQVFYQEQAGGFGCLHQSCSGSCTGSFVTNTFQQVTGIVRKLERSARFNEFSSSASGFVSATAKERFFALPAVQAGVESAYLSLYGDKPRPDFLVVERDSSFASAYEYVKTELYGISFYLIAPRATRPLSGGQRIVYTKAACECGISAGACKMGSGGALGFKVYWCQGNCNGCMLTISKK